MEVILDIEGQEFTVNKDLLCEYSDYFRAMFSGNYIENEQDKIEIDIVDAESMKIIIKYMKVGLTDLMDMPLNSMADLSLSANFLQITELIKQIEYTLESNLTHSNWLETKKVAEISSYGNLEKYCAAFGLLSFEFIQPECIPSVSKLFWYLSHPYLNTDSELKVVEFGFKWISNAQLPADAFFIVLGCLDVQRLTTEELSKMKNLILEHENSLASKVIDCLHFISTQGWEFSSVVLLEKRQFLIEEFTEVVYTEVLNLVRESKRRKTQLVPCVGACKNVGVDASKTFSDIKDQGPHHLYTFTEESGFQQWVEVAEKNLWGWSIASWGPHRLIVVGGEYGRGTGIFNKDVAVYNTLKKDWIKHGVQLPSHRHAGVIVHGDQLYIIGGVGAFRVILDSTIVYDLEQKSYRTLSNLPDVIQKPAVCIHKGSVYVASQKDVFQLQRSNENDCWRNILSMNIRANFMVSLGDYIYITQSYFGHLFKFKPGSDTKLEMPSYFFNPVAAMCKIGMKIIAFTQTACGQIDIVSVEEFDNGQVRVIQTEKDGPIRLNDALGSCTLAMEIPPLEVTVSNYPHRYLTRFKKSKEIC